MFFTFISNDVIDFTSEVMFKFVAEDISYDGDNGSGGSLVEAAIDDFKLEFGRLWENNKKEVILADEISPDTCRLWDVKSERKLDKDRFRKDLGNIIQAYQEVARRLGIMPETTNISEVNFKKPTSISIKKK